MLTLPFTCFIVIKRDHLTFCVTMRNRLLLDIAGHTGSRGGLHAKLGCKHAELCADHPAQESFTTCWQSAENKQAGFGTLIGPLVHLPGCVVGPTKLELQSLIAACSIARDAIAAVAAVFLRHTVWPCTMAKLFCFSANSTGVCVACSKFKQDNCLQGQGAPKVKPGYPNSAQLDPICVPC